MIKYSIDFKVRNDNYDICRMDVFVYYRHRIKHLFTFHFKLFDDPKGVYPFNRVVLMHQPVPKGLKVGYPSLDSLVDACKEAVLVQTDVEL